MAFKGKKAAPAMRKSARVGKAKKVDDEDASALSHSPESDNIENGAPASTLQDDEAASTLHDDEAASTLHNDEAASTSISNRALKFDSTVAIQRSFRADLNVFLSKSPAELEQARSVLLHQLSLITEAKALKDIPGGKFEGFIFFNKFPTEVQKLVWEQLVDHEQKVYIIEAFHAKTERKFQKKVVHFRCHTGKPDMLLSICAGSREVVLKHQNVAIGGDLPGFKGLIHMNAEKDIIVINGTKEAFSTKGMMKGVKKLLLDDTGRDCMFRDPSRRRVIRRRVPAESQQYLAEAINRFFPDLTEMYVHTVMHGTFSVMSYIKSPAAFKLIPELEEGDWTLDVMHVQRWTQAWARMQKSLGGESIYPEVKIMWVLKQSED